MTKEKSEKTEQQVLLDYKNRIKKAVGNYSERIANDPLGQIRKAQWQKQKHILRKRQKQVEP
jgi:hypothetical protein